MSQELTLQQFNEETAKPGRRFLSITKARITFSYTLRTLAQWYKGLPKSIQVAALSTTTIAIFLITLIAYPTLAPMVKLAYYRSTGKDDAVFQNYYRTRPQNTLAAEADTALNRTISQDISMIAPEHAQPDKIIITKTNTKIGPASSLCQESNPYYPNFLNEQIYEHAYYQHYSKALSTDSQGNILELYLTNDDGTYEYRGGKYAVLRELPAQIWDSPIDTQNLQVIPATEPGSGSDEIPGTNDTTTSDTLIPTDTQDIEAPYFYSLNSIETINGKDYFVYESRFDYYCYESHEAEPTTFPAIQKTWIDPDTYAIIKEILYFHTVSDKSIVRETATQTSYVDPTMKKEVFAFNIDTDIQIVPYTEERDVLNIWLESTNASILIPAETDNWIINSIYSSKAINDFYTIQNNYLHDRTFYASNAVGDHFFNSIRNISALAPTPEIFLVSDLEMNATSTINNLTLNTAVYSDVFDEPSFKNQHGLTEKYEEAQITILINNNSVTGKRFTTTSDVTYELREPDSTTDSESSTTEIAPAQTSQGTYDNHYYLVPFEGNMYVIIISGERSELSDLLNKALGFTRLSTNNPHELEQIKTIYSETSLTPDIMPAQN